MSWQVTRLIWKLEADALKKAVLARMADLANPEGAGIYISQERLAIESGCSPRSVRNTLKWAVDSNVLKEVDSAGRRTKQYCFDMDTLTRYQSHQLADEYRQEVPPSRQDVPGTWQDVPPTRQEVPQSEECEVAPDATLTGTTCQSDRQEVPPYKREPINRPIRKPFEELVCSKPEPTADGLANEIYEILIAVPGFSRGGNKPGYIAEMIEEFVDIEDCDWIPIARGCRDWCRVWTNMGENSTRSYSMSQILRDYISKNWRPASSSKRSTTPNSTSEPPPMPADFAGVE